MEKILVIDGLNDYRIATQDSRFKRINNRLLALLSILEEFEFTISFFDARDSSFTINSIIKYINENKIDNIIISGNFNNYSIISLILDSLPEEIKKYVFFINLSQNNFDSVYGSNVTILNYDDRNSFQANISELIKKMNLKTEIDYIEEPDCYKFLGNLDSYTVNINLSSGCSRKCNFCTIAGSTDKYKDIPQIVKEIEFLFKRGVKGFHIESHNFTSNIEYVREFCLQLKNHFKNVDYKWSCFVLPEKLAMFDDELLQLMIETNLVKVELSVESGSTQIRNSFEINISNDRIKNVVSRLYNAGILSIQVNLILGSYNEDDITIRENSDFINELFSIAPGIIDVCLNCYFDNRRKWIPNTNCEGLNSMNGLRKLDFLYPTKAFEKNELIYQKNKLITQIKNLQKQTLHLLSPKKRFEILNLRNYMIVSQISMNFLQNLSMNTVLSKKINNKFIFYSWEIQDDLLEYTPHLLAAMIDVNDNEKIIPFNPLLVPPNEVPYLTINQEQFYIIEKSQEFNYSLKEIIKLVSEKMEINFNEANDFTLQFMRKLENLELITYVKIFK